jgi:pimeloyl-ACP methyl ester carboxylesterase
VSATALDLAEHTYFWVGVEREAQPDGSTATTGTHMYVESFVPAQRRHELPVVLVHGGGGQGVAWLGRGDGRPGWAHYFVQEGYAVYVIDRPGYGRNPPHPQLIGPLDQPTPFEAMVPLFEVGARGGRWAGSGDLEDRGIDEFMAQQRPMNFTDAAFQQEVQRERGAQLLDRIGPAIVLTHSAGGPFGWLVADARPELVRALVAVEGLGPGLLAVPLAFDPPAASVEELELVPFEDPQEPDMGQFARLPREVQADPPRRLESLSRVPIAVVTSDDERFAALNRSTIAFLRQGGCEVDELVLAEHGIRGNGHFAPLEENNREVLGVVLEWLDRRGLA